MLYLTVGYWVIHRKYNNRRWVVQGAKPLFSPDVVCDQICQPSNEDEDEMKINSHYQTDPYGQVGMPQVRKMQGVSPYKNRVSRWEDLSKSGSLPWENSQTLVWPMPRLHKLLFPLVINLNCLIELLQHLSGLNTNEWSVYCHIWCSEHVMILPLHLLRWQNLPIIHLRSTSLKPGTSCTTLLAHTNTPWSMMERVMEGYTPTTTPMEMTDQMQIADINLCRDTFFPLWMSNGTPKQNTWSPCPPQWQSTCSVCLCTWW